MAFARKRSANTVKEGYTSRGFKIFDSAPPVDQCRKKRLDRVEFQTRLESQRMQEWINQEDDFELSQVKHRALLKVIDNRGSAADFAVLCTLEPEQIKDFTEKRILERGDFDVKDPTTLIQETNSEQLLHEILTLKSKIQKLEKSNDIRAFWDAIEHITLDKTNALRQNNITSEADRVISNVQSDIEAIFHGKSYDELRALQNNIRNKLNNDMHIDTDYWTHLDASLSLWLSRLVVKKYYNSISTFQIKNFLNYQYETAKGCENLLKSTILTEEQVLSKLRDSDHLDPHQVTTLLYEDRNLQRIDKEDYFENLKRTREQISKIRFVHRISKKMEEKHKIEPKVFDIEEQFAQEQIKHLSGDFINNADDEEVEFLDDFNYEIPPEEQPEYVRTPEIGVQICKPKFYNRLVKGIEWNRYNAAHYNDKNPPPKVIQGYRFNIFYPQLKNKHHPPTYKVIRDRSTNHNRSTTGEPESCIIKFMAGSPYEDIAFKIVDKDWDYSGKYERIFKSQFNNGVLMLYFMFKRSYYRK